MEFQKSVYATEVKRRYSTYFSDVKVREMGDNLLTEITCDDLNATQTCAAFRKSKMGHEHISKRGPSSGECLSPMQLQHLERVSVELHEELFGSSSSFPTSEFN